MPYLNELPTYKCKCGKIAKTQLYNDRGGSMGYYCNPCGKRALRTAQARVDAEAIERAKQQTVLNVVDS